MEGVYKGQNQGFLKLKHGFITGMAFLSFIYPVIFVFGVSKLSVIILMYAVVLSAVAASFLWKPPISGRFRVSHVSGHFEDELRAVDGNLLIFSSHVVNRNAIYSMEKIEGNKPRNLQEYFH